MRRARNVIISVVQLCCELQRDWKRTGTVKISMDLFAKTGGRPECSSRSTATRDSGVYSVAPKAGAEVHQGMPAWGDGHTFFFAL